MYVSVIQSINSNIWNVLPEVGEHRWRCVSSPIIPSSLRPLSLSLDFARDDVRCSVFAVLCSLFAVRCSVFAVHLAPNKGDADDESSCDKDDEYDP